MRPRSASFLGLSFFAGAALAASNPVPVGGELAINGYTTGWQHTPTVEVALNGEFVVAWRSFGSTGDDSSDASVQLRRFSGEGTPLGSEVQVNSFTPGSQSSPSLRIAASGAFVVVWDSAGSSGNDSSSLSVQGRRFTAAGVADGAQFQVNSYTPSAQRYPSVGVAAGGEFVVTWESFGSNGGDSDGSSVQGRRFAAAGSAVGADFQVNTVTAYNQTRPSVGVAGSGEFVVVWQSFSASGGQPASYNILGQRHTESGTAVGGEIVVNSYLTSGQSDPAVAVAGDGEFVVVWRSYGSAGDDDSFYSVQDRRFSPDGAPEGDDFQVNSYTSSAQFYPAVAVAEDGEFVVVWASFGSAGTDNDGMSVQGQRFSPSGERLGDPFEVNTYTPGNQASPSVAIDRHGDFVVVWDSYGSSGADTSGLSVWGQRYRVTGDLEGTVFFDQDFDGIKDGSEPGLAGVSVELYDDELLLERTSVTDGSGNYTLKPKEGSWHLRFVRPASFSFAGQDVGADDTVDSDADPFDGETDPFSIAIDVLDSTIDAGLTNGVGDKVWNDLDRDGIRDGGELGLAGVTVRLRNKGGAELAASLTDAAGRYHFNSMPPAEYYVDFDAPAGFAFSPPHAGAADDADSDADEVTGNSPIFDFELAEVDTTIDAGMYQRSSIGGRVWDDLDGDGVREGGEAGIDGLLVRLLDGTGTNPLASQATSGGGFYAFDGLATASYVIEVVPLGVLDLSPQNAGGDDAVDSDFDPMTARTPSIAFTEGSVVADVDCGLGVVALFFDGLESGDLSRWSVVVP